jgi:NADH-quinone oxidoreductase subunit E
MALSEGFHARAREICDRYPRPRSAILLLLHEAQDEVGYITNEVIREIGQLLGLESADVAGVVTFYTMYKRKHPGRYLISLCTNVGCQAFGADGTADTLREIVGPEHETTEDGMLSWEQVECLAYCNKAPIAQINYHDVPHLTPQRAERLCGELRAGRPLQDVLGELRTSGSLEETPRA